jgi:hypothetical protein
MTPHHLPPKAPANAAPPKKMATRQLRSCLKVIQMAGFRDEIQAPD